MFDLWLMVLLVIALLLGNLWLLKRNSKQQLKRKSTATRPAQSAQVAAAMQTSPLLASSAEKPQSETPTGKSAGNPPAHSTDRDSSAD